jgi:apolipoprotein N-acyltransferase
VFFLTAAAAAIAAGTGSVIQRWAMTSVALAMLGGVVGFGLWRLAAPVQGQVPVGLMASDIPANAFIADPGKPTQALLRAYLERARPLVAEGARIIVLPEKIGVTVPNTTSADRAILQDFADRTHTAIMVGLCAL